MEGLAMLKVVWQILFLCSGSRFRGASGAWQFVLNFGPCVSTINFANGCAGNSGMHHAVAKQQLHCNRGMVFSTWSVPRCYKQDTLGAAMSSITAGVQLWAVCCEKLVAEAGGSFTIQRKGKNFHHWSCYQATVSEDCNRLRRRNVSIVICKVCRTVRA
jgi:hypothetical protein